MRCFRLLRRFQSRKIVRLGSTHSDQALHQSISLASISKIANITYWNPINFLYLSREIADNWIEIKKAIRRSRSSASQPIFNWTAGRALLPINFSERDKRIANLSVMNNFLLRSDISRFYHSIYTHALAWALHGKAAAKKIELMPYLEIGWICSRGTDKMDKR